MDQLDISFADLFSQESLIESAHSNVLSSSRSFNRNHSESTKKKVLIKSNLSTKSSSNLLDVSSNSNTSINLSENVTPVHSVRNETDSFDISFNSDNSMSVSLIEPAIQCNKQPSNSTNISKQTDRLVNHFLKFNQSYNSLESMAQIMNLMDNASIQVPESKYKILKQIDPQFKVELHIYCASCKNYTPTTVPQTSCETCSKLLKTSQSNFFVYIPIEQQLRKVVDEHWDEITSYPVSPGDVNVMKDVQDSIIYKKVEAKYASCRILSLVGCTDGAVAFKNNSKSLWAIQLYQNYLHPAMRYVPNNIMCVAFHCDSKKPDMKTFFLPLLKELKSIKMAGGLFIEKDGRKQRFMPLITHFVADLPAKCEVQEMITYSGYNGCSYCLHPGIKIKQKTNAFNSRETTYVRYIGREPSDPLRTHDETIKIYQKLKHTFSCKPINGIKTVSCMVAAVDFDLIHSFGIDYMHCVLEGVTKKLMSLWLDSINHKEKYYIKSKDQQLLSQRITNIKPISDVSRKPGAVSQRSEYKANELRTLLLYYLRYCLSGILNKCYIDHFQLLSAATYTLLKSKISPDEIDQAEVKLVQFANQFEEMYGQYNVTMNVHLIRHLANAVRHLGPLWAQSSFALEANNGIITKTAAKTSILHSVAMKYNMRCSLSGRGHEEVQKDGIMLKGKLKMKLTTTQQNTLGTLDLEYTNPLTIYDKVSFHKKEFTSMKSKDVSTIDYFVKLKNGEFGAISFFFVSNFIVHAFIDMYETIDTADHLFTVQPSGLSQIHSIREFETKLMYIKIGPREVVCQRPNIYEKT